VVIAIIAILASMLLPALKKARDSTLATVCKNNQKQIGLILQSYVGENDSYWPLALYWYNSGSRFYWVFCLQNGGYIDDYRNICFTPEGCPHYGSGAKKLAKIYCPTLAKRSEIWISYGAFVGSNKTTLKAVMGYGGDNSTEPEWTRDNKIKSPSTKVTLGEVDCNLYPAIWPFNGYGTANYTFPFNFHNSGANFLYADNHVEWHKAMWLNTWDSASWQEKVGINQ
jgi:prepilin-type processing-associated H-X9-DG protein